MREAFWSMQMTLEGYSTGPNDEMDYIPPFNDERMWHDIHEEMWKNLEAVDTLILGRRTYQIWEQYCLLQQTILRGRRMIEGFRGTLKRNQKFIYLKLPSLT